MPGSPESLSWNAIETVLLDMDGTLLDLRFDNWFWQQHVPAAWAKAQGVTLSAAQAALRPRFDAARGRLEWYCIDHWSGELGLDIAAIKRAVREQVAWLPGAERFLARLGRAGKRRVLVTNAHPETLAIKDRQLGLAAHLDDMYSTHPFGVPKEHPGFWPQLHAAVGFDPGTTLLIDDTPAVLEAARDFGIVWLRAIRRPDSASAARDTGGFTAVDTVEEL